MTRLRMHEEYVVGAREDLLTHDLIAYDPLLTQLANRTRLAWFHDQESVKESD